MNHEVDFLQADKGENLLQVDTMILMGMVKHFQSSRNSNFALSLQYVEKKLEIKLIFFSIWVFFHEHSQITGLQGKEEGISLAPHFHFYPLHRHLDISQAITAENSPLHIASSWTRTGNLWFPSASC